MARKTVSEIIIDTLQAAGVQRVYGLVGDSLHGLADAIRARPGIEFIQVRHEEAGAFAAGAEAHVTGQLAVCAGSCGAGNTHLVNGLFDCHRNRMPVLALVAQIPSAEIGTSYSQETHPERLFQECSHYCEVIAAPEQAVHMVEGAIQAALGLSGVGVVVLPSDVAYQEAEAPEPRLPGLGHDSAIVPAKDKIAQAAELLNECERVVILAGLGCDSAHAELLQAAQALQAPIVHTLRGRECVQPNNPYDVGMTGLLGMPAGYHALLDADGVLMLGTDFPYRQFFPENARVVQVDKHAERIGRRTRVEVGLHGSVIQTLGLLLPRLRPRTDATYLQQAQARHREDEAYLAGLAVAAPGEAALRPQYLACLLDVLAPDDTIFTCDVGLPTVWASRYLHMNGHRRLLGSFIHGSMAGALSQAIGIQLASPSRQVIALSGDGSFAMLLSELLTLRQLRVPIKVIIFNNNAAGMTEVARRAAGSVEYGPESDNPDFSRLAEAAGIKGYRVQDPAQLEGVLREALRHDGPVIVDAVVQRQELSLPPHLGAMQAGGYNLYGLKALLSGRGNELLEPDQPEAA